MTQDSSECFKTSASELSRHSNHVLNGLSDGIVCQSLYSDYAGTSNKEYDLLVLEDDSTSWQCILCDIEEMAAKFPFTHSTNMELNDLYGLDFLSQLQLLPSYELRSKLSHIPTRNDFDIDENYVQIISSKYYDISELPEF